MEAPALKWRHHLETNQQRRLDGPLYSQAGDLLLEKNKKFPKGYLYTDMDWFVQGVVGEAPGQPPPTVEGRGSDIRC